MEGRRRRFELAGWLLFGAGIVVFLLRGLLAGDVLTSLGSLLFLLGVITFLVPYSWRE